MRKIEEMMIQCIKEKKSKNLGNTEISVRNGDIIVYLFGNMIAHINEGKNEAYFTTCGWSTNTTKSRLNCILQFYNLPRITQKNFVFYIDGKEFYNKTFQFNK